MIRALCLLLGLCSASALADCPTILSGVSYPCTVTDVTASIAGSPPVYRANINAYERMIKPRYNGQLTAIATSTPFYPSILHWAQFIVFVDDTSGALRMFHGKNPNPVAQEEWWVASTVITAPCVNTEWCFQLRYRGSAVELNQVDFPGTVDWRVAAKYYKDWAQNQTWYRSHGKLAGTKLQYMQTAATNTYTYYDSEMDMMQNSFSTGRVGVFMTQYRADAFDVDYPDYTCLAGANCAAWLQNIKTDGAIAFPYINGSLWDTTHATYSAANMCLDSGGAATIYGGNLRYVDPLLSSFPTTLRTAFNAIQATDTSTSEGVYIDVAAAVNPPVCYYASVANYAAWLTGVKASLAAFDDKIVAAEGVAEIYLPYVDIAYVFPVENPYKTSTVIGMYTAVYGAIPNLYVGGWDAGSSDSARATELNKAVTATSLGHTLYWTDTGVTNEGPYAKKLYMNKCCGTRAQARAVVFP